MRIPLLNIEIRRFREPEKSPVELMCDAVDDMNYAWKRLQECGETKIRPWVIWEDKRVVVTQLNGGKTIFHE